MRAIEAAVGPGLRCARELSDQVEQSEPGRDAQVARLEPEHVDDLAVPPEESRDERRAPVPARREIGPRADVEQQLREPAVVGVARLVELRPAVVVAAIGIRAPLDQQANDLEIAGHAEEVVPVRAADVDEVGMVVEERGEPPTVVVLDRPVREHERRRRLAALPKRLHVPAQLGPAREAVPLCKIPTRLGDAHSVHGRDPVGPPLVVLEIGAERLLHALAADVPLELLLHGTPP